MTELTPGMEEAATGRLRRLALLVEYEGTRYHGFQSQKNAASIQDALEGALLRLTGEQRRIRGAGRTDAGVHAQGQVASFDTGALYAPEVFLKAMNHYLPEDISVKDAQEVSPDFDPRRWAVSREYRYRILNSDTPSPMMRRFTHTVKRPLDAEAMNNAAALLEGERDLAPFSGPLTNGRRSTTRRVYRCSVEKEAGLVTLKMVATGFLPQQVRRTAGALIEVGLGRLSVRQFEDLAGCGVLGTANRVAPAKGLSLVNVSYAVPIFPQKKAISTAFDDLLESLSGSIIAGDETSSPGIGDIWEEKYENEPVVTGTRAT